MTFGSLAWTLSSLALVVAAALLFGRLAAAAGFARRARGPRRLMLQDSLPLDARRRLLLVSCDGRSFLVMTSPSRDLMLGWIDDPPGAAPASVLPSARPS